MASILCDGYARFLATHLREDAVFSMEHESVKQDPVQRIEHGFRGHPSLVLPRQLRSVANPRRHRDDDARAFPVDTCVRSPCTSLSPSSLHGCQCFPRAIPEAPFFFFSKAQRCILTCCSRPFVHKLLGMGPPPLHVRSSILAIARLDCQGMANHGWMPRLRSCPFPSPFARPRACKISVEDLWDRFSRSS